MNAVDEDGNSPLMLAVRDSPLSWHCLHMLILFGARIRQKNSRGICPLDLAPELRKIQETCVESLFQMACKGPSSASNATATNTGKYRVSNYYLFVAQNNAGSQTGSGDKDEAAPTQLQPSSGSGSGGGPNSSSSTQERLMKTAAMISATKHLRKSNVDAGEYLQYLTFFTYSTESLLLPASFCERGSLSKLVEKLIKIM